MLQLGDDKKVWAIDMRCLSDTDRELLKVFLSDSRARKVGHNIKFDVKMIREELGIWIENVYCTQVAEMMLMCGIQKRGFSLDKLSEKYLDFKYAKSSQLDLFNPKEELITKETRLTFKNIKEDAFTKKQIVYGVKDIEHTHRIYSLQYKELFRLDLLGVAWLEFLTLLALADMEYNGFYLDAKKWTETTEKNRQLANHYLGEILRLIKDEKLRNFTDFQRSLFDPETNKVKINLGSSKQVIELCKALDIPTRIKDLKKSRESSEDVFKDSVEEKVLKQYLGRHPIIEPYLAYKRVEKACTTYGDKFLEKHHNPVTGAIHTNFWQLVDTGRLASNSPNVQNIPSKRKLPGYRECFVPRGQNRKLIVADYSSQEARILADKSKDINMSNFFKFGDGDFHSHTARLMFDIAFDVVVDDIRRALAKTINFGMETNAEIKVRKFGETSACEEIHDGGNPDPSLVVEEGVETWLISIKINSPCVK